MQLHLYSLHTCIYSCMVSNELFLCTYQAKSEEFDMLSKMRISKMNVIRRKLLLSIQLAKDSSIQRKRMFSQMPFFDERI